jgi:hypothetical protein
MISMASKKDRETIHKLWVEYHLKTSQTLSTISLTIILALFSAMTTSNLFPSLTIYLQIVFMIYAAGAVYIVFDGMFSARKEIRALEKSYGLKTKTNKN